MENHRRKIADPWIEEQLADLSRRCNWEPDTTKGLEILHRRRRAHMSWSRIALLSGATLAATFAILVALPPTRVFAQHCVNACLAQVSVVKRVVLDTGATLGRSQDDLTPIQERMPAINFTLLDASGQPMRLSNYRGFVVLLNFWATWCAPCRREIPWLSELQQEHRNAGFAVVGISLDDGGWRSIRPFLKAHHIDYPIVLDDGQTARSYSVDALPTTFLIDRYGRVALVHRGLAEKEIYEREIAKLLQEQ